MRGKVITVRGPVEPEELGRVSMHEHLYLDVFDYDRDEVVAEERPITPARRGYMMREAVPFLKECGQHGGRALVDASMAPWRAWPTFYREASEAADLHIILCTGFYREIELGTYWAKTPETAIWPFVRRAPVEELAEFCIREIAEGIDGTDVRAGAIKLGSSQPEMTQAETKAFRAGARAQKATGVHITTHCTKTGAVASQLELLDREGVDLNRVAIGHIGWALGDPEFRKACVPWMKRGASFLATNLGVGEDGGEKWRPLVNGIHAVFDAGLGDRLGFGLDCGFCSGPGTTKDGRFGYCSYIPPPPFLHLYTHTLPAFRRMGLTPEEEDAIMRANPQRILPVR